MVDVRNSSKSSENKEGDIPEPSTGTTSNPHQEFGFKEQLETLIEAIRLLTKQLIRPLHTLEQRSEGARVVEPSSSINKKHDLKSSFHSLQPEDIKVSKLNEEWVLEDTGFTALYNVCQQMRDVLWFTQNEAEKAFCDAQRSELEEFETRLRITEMEKTLKRVVKENLRLNKELKRKNREHQAMTKCFRIIMRKNEDLNQEREMAVMDLHNRIVSMSSFGENQKAQNKEMKNTDDSINETDSSADHNDNKNPEKSDISKGNERSDIPTPKKTNGIKNEIKVNHPTSSAPEKNSKGTLEVPTDKNSKTLKDMSPVVKGETKGGGQRSSETESKQQQILSPQQTQQKITPQKSENKHAHQKSPQKQQVQTQRKGTYRIMFTSKIGLQFKKVPLFESSTSDDKEPSSDDFSLSKHAFLVCGSYGFDTSNCSNPPTIGARLIGLNDFSFERGEWSMEDIQKLLATTPKPITMVFRDDPLEDQQRAELVKVAARVVREHNLSRKAHQNDFLKISLNNKFVNAVDKLSFPSKPNKLLSNASNGLLSVIKNF